MCLSADTKLCCCKLCGLLLVSILSCIFTHFLDTPEVLTAVMWHPLLSHSTCDDSSAVYVDIKMFYIDLNIELFNYSPFSQKKLHVILLAALSLFHCFFFIIIIINFMETMNVLCDWVSRGKVYHRHGLCSVTACSLVHGYQHFLEESDKMGSYPRRVVFMSRFLRNTNVNVCMGWRLIFYDVGCGNLIPTAGRRCFLWSEPPSANCSVYISV